jgi:hypothetical protein
MITRFSFTPTGDQWFCAATRHWHLDGRRPR